MESESKILLSDASFNLTSEGAVIAYQADGGEIEGKPFGESFVNVYEGERLIFVGRTLDETGEVTYVLTETDFVTGKMKVYGVRLAEERDLPDEQLEALKTVREETVKSLKR